MTALLTRELSGLRGGLDLVLVDTGAGLSGDVMDVLAMADDILVVSTPNIASTLDAYGIVKVAREERFRGRVRLLLNQVADAAQAEAVAGRIRACAERFLGFEPPLLGYLVQDPLVEASNQERRPLQLSRPDSVNARLFDGLAGALAGDARAGGVPAGTAAGAGG